MRIATQKLWMLGLLGLGALAACGPEAAAPTDGQDQSASESALTVDNDGDGIDDAYENQLAAKFAPEVRLPPDSIDWTRPANVDWYLTKVSMRFDHSGCPDHEIKALGTLTQANLSTQSHATTNWYCGHTSTVYPSSAKHLEFFLQPPDDATHAGTAPSGWRVYVHVKKSTLVTGGFDVQYWFFYAYNDAAATINHEADWEHITVTTDAAGAFQSAWYAQHNSGARYTAAQLLWNGNHPIVYSADGTHASYKGPGTWAGPVVPDYCYDGGPVWQTWTNFVNVGETAAPLNGQSFIKYGGRWGEIGELEDTSGPPTPSVQGSWTTY